MASVYFTLPSLSPSLIAYLGRSDADGPIAIELFSYDGPHDELVETAESWVCQVCRFDKNAAPASECSFCLEARIEPGVPAPHVAARRIPRTDLDVDFHALLGQGGFGLVLRGGFDGQNVAVKVIRPDHLTFARVRKVFLKEATVASNAHQ